MVKDMSGNETESSVSKFLDDLDKKDNIGPKPISGVDYSGASIVELLDCDVEIAKKLFAQPSEFLYDESDQLYVNITDEVTGVNEKLYLFSDEKLPKFEEMCEEVVKKLPDVTYDLECGGYPTRQAEAGAIYKVAVINQLQESYYQGSIDNIL